MNYYYYNPNELYHYGIKRRSGRYPWGSGKRPHQSLVGRYKAYKKKKKQSKNLKKAREKAAENRKLAADKERVLKSGTAKEVQKYKGKLTNEELRAVSERIRLETQIDEYAAKEIQSGMKKIDQAMQNIKKVTEWGEIGIKAYNTMAKAYNSTEAGRRDPITIIGQPEQQRRRES